MPLDLRGSCRCGAVAFSVSTHTPVPYQLCYCSICRKTAGGGGYAINIMGSHRSLTLDRNDAVGIYRAALEQPDGSCRISKGQRHFCTRCATALWLWDETWPDLVHPLASAIDTELPAPTERTHIMLRFKPAWVEPRFGPKDKQFNLYPAQSIEDWHKSRGLWIE